MVLVEGGDGLGFDVDLGLGLDLDLDLGFDGWSDCGAVWASLMVVVEVPLV